MGNSNISCSSGFTQCNKACYNLSSDNIKCGTSCANAKACPYGTLCKSGACQKVPCQSYQTDCSGVCVDLSSDNNACGKCGNKCAAGTACFKGACSKLSVVIITVQPYDESDNPLMHSDGRSMEYNVTFNYAQTVTGSQLKQGICDQMNLCSPSRLMIASSAIGDDEIVPNGSTVKYVPLNAGTNLCRARQSSESCKHPDAVNCPTTTCDANVDLKCCNGVCLSINNAPANGKKCFDNVQWPNCDEMYTMGFGFGGGWQPACSNPAAADSYCCMSEPTPDKTKSNCPDGWSSDPTNSAEWCTYKLNLFSGDQRLYRHKCERSPKC